MNCPSKLGISGWEIKCEFCPFCSGWNVDPSEYRLIGNDRAGSLGSLGALARTPSLSLSATRRESRTSSFSTVDSNSGIAAMASEKNKAMNERVNAYFARAPQPQTPATPTPLREADDESDEAITTISSDTSSEGQESLRRSSTSSQTSKLGFLKKMQRKSKRMSFGIFK
jgi:hypothetical protein